LPHAGQLPEKTDDEAPMAMRLTTHLQGATPVPPSQTTLQ